MLLRTSGWMRKKGTLTTSGKHNLAQMMTRKEMAQMERCLQCSRQHNAQPVESCHGVLWNLWRWEASNESDYRFEWVNRTFCYPKRFGCKNSTMKGWILSREARLGRRRNAVYERVGEGREVRIPSTSSLRRRNRRAALRYRNTVLMRRWISRKKVQSIRGNRVQNWIKLQVSLFRLRFVRDLYRFMLNLVRWWSYTQPPNHLTPMGFFYC